MKTQILTDQSTRYIPAFMMGLGAFLATFDVTAVSLALPSIAQTYALDVAGSIWVMNIYSLTFAICLLAAGAVADRYGNKRSLSLGAFVFLASSIVCAFAPNYAMLVFGRFIQGIGAAFIVCGGYALMGQIYTQKADRVQAFAIMGTIGGSALAIGPGLGGVITDLLGWEWIFLVNIPICAAIIVGTIPVKDNAAHKKRARFDLAGVLTFSLLLFSLTWFFLQGPTFGAFDLGNLVFGLGIALLFILFLYSERRAEVPAIDLSLFKRPSFIGLSLVPLCLSISYWALIVYIPLFLGGVFDIGFQAASYIMLFFTVPMFVVPYLTKELAAKLNDTAFYTLGLFVVSAGCLTIAAGAHLHSYSISIAGMMLAGSGAAAMQSQVSGALIAAAPRDQAGAVSAILTASRQGGFAVGVAFLSVVLGWETARRWLAASEFTVLFFTCSMVALCGAILTFALLHAEDRRDGLKEDD